MKEKILFLMPALPIGGTETALIALLNYINYDLYDVSLLLIEKRGERIVDVPKQVKIFEMSEKDRFWLMDGKYSLLQMKNGNHILWGLRRLFFSALKALSMILHRNYDTWAHIEKYVSSINEHYDVAIDYSGSYTGFLIDKINANQRLTWNHFDYRIFEKNKDINNIYFERVDKIISVSPGGAATLKKYYPKLSDKIFFMYNLIDIETIYKKRSEKLQDPKEYALLKNKGLIICSVGRLEDEKNFKLAIETAYELQKKNRKFIWFIIGEGSQRKILEDVIKRYKLENNVFLLGSRSNPYPYMNLCDIYVQTSKNEGRCIAVTEAQVLEKPCIVTDVQGLNDIVFDGKEGFVVTCNAKKIAEAILNMDSLKRENISKQLHGKYITENLNSMRKFYSWIKM